jgi:hypothetical protein
MLNQPAALPEIETLIDDLVGAGSKRHAAANVPSEQAGAKFKAGMGL